MIGIFDSGIGGVTVLRELIKVLPMEDYIYYSDTKNCPYGDKSENELIDICDNIVKYLIDNGAKIIVIACNTASAICKEYLREKYSIPIVAIEPAYKMVHDLNDDSKTLIMATHATINNKNFKNLYNQYNNNNTILCECSGLADLIEINDIKGVIEYLKNKISGYRNIKNVVLGCTHYPLIKKEICEVLGNVNFYDGSVGVSMQVKRILTDKNLLNQKGTGNIRFIDSKNDLKKKEVFMNILDRSEL